MSGIEARLYYVTGELDGDYVASYEVAADPNEALRVARWRLNLHRTGTLEITSIVHADLGSLLVEPPWWDEPWTDDPLT